MEAKNYSTLSKQQFRTLAKETNVNKMSLCCTTKSIATIGTNGFEHVKEFAMSFTIVMPNEYENWVLQFFHLTGMIDGALCSSKPL